MKRLKVLMLSALMVLTMLAVFAGPAKADHFPEPYNTSSQVATSFGQAYSYAVYCGYYGLPSYYYYDYHTSSYNSGTC